MMVLILKVGIAWTALSIVTGVTFARYFLWAARHPMEETK